MREQEKNKIIDYWKKTAKHDHDTMIALFEKERYSDSLFFGHIVLEKIIKGIVVKHTGEQAPYIHDLVRLIELTDLDLTKEEVLLLNRINTFNIRARYPDYKLSFYKTYQDKEKTEKYLNQIKKIYKKLCRELRLKK
jgi:HEPN domain-containing protein